MDRVTRPQNFNGQHRLQTCATARQTQVTNRCHSAGIIDYKPVPQRGKIERMDTLLIALGALVLYLIAYHTYGRWLARKLFKLDANATVPSRELADGHDYVPTKKEIIFGHHFTSIAGTGPIVGPALAVIWGWVPALIWVLVGSIFIGAVHDFGALIVSMRNRGQTIGEVAGRLINPRVKILFLLILFLALTIVLAIFGLVIASIFALYPAAVLSVWLEIPLALIMGWLVYRKGKSPHAPAVIALLLMMAAIVLAVYVPAFQLALQPFDLALGGNTFTISPVVMWTLILFVYCYIASTMPVWRLLQPRDYINSHQLVLCLALIVFGIGAATFFHEGGAPIVAPAVQTNPAGAPPIMPFLFVTIACGAISGFHCLVSSGTSSKQIACETDAQFVGYGSMLTEGFLAVLVILACCAGLGLGVNFRAVGNPGLMSAYQLGHKEIPEPINGLVTVWHPVLPNMLDQYSATAEGGIKFKNPDVDSVNVRLDTRQSRYDTSPLPVDLSVNDSVMFNESKLTYLGDLAFSLEGKFAWQTRYHSWSASSGLAPKVGAFVDGAGNFVAALGIPRPVAIAIMAVLVASFAATTLDTATRLQRYVIQELATTVRVQPLTTKHGATAFALVTAAVVAAVPPPGMTWATGMGKGGLTLWPVFGATNQLLAGLAFLVIAFYLARRKLPTWFIIGPAILMLGVPLWAMTYELGLGKEGGGWIAKGQWHLVATAIVILILQIWMIAEALRLWPRIKGVLEAELPPVRRGFEVVVEE